MSLLGCYSTAYASFKSYISPFVSDASLYGTHSIRIGGANDPGFRSLDSSMKDRHVGWKNPKSKFRVILKLCQNSLLRLLGL